MTDSQTALHLINMAIHRPEDMRINKDKEIVLQIAQMLAAWPRCIHLLKVRAHVDVIGNTLADQLAKDAQADDACPVFDEAGKAGRGQRWIVYKPPQQHAGGGGDPPQAWAVNNLKGTRAFASRDGAGQTGAGLPDTVSVKFNQAPG
jgi:hypothetical protein